MNDHSTSDDRTRQLEEIVAYLDGELTPQEGAQVERRLASDESYRQRLQGLQRAWSALDELPTATVDDRFSQTTMEMVVASARGEVELQTQALPLQKRKQRLSTLLMATTAVLLGALVYRLGWDNPNRSLVADLPEIQYIDIYSQFWDVEFLRQLREQLGPGPWPPIDSSEQSNDELDQFRLVASTNRREDWLETLAVDDRVTLRAKFNRFRSMPPDQQKRLRALHQEIESAPDAAELQQTMLDYQQWLDDLPPSEQFELRELPLKERVKQIASEVHAYDNSLELTPDELRILFRSVRQNLPWLRDFVQRGMRRRPTGRDLRDFQEMFRVVREGLPEEKREQFDQLTPPERIQHCRSWLRQAAKLRGAGRPDQPSEQELEKFFVEEVDATAKEELLAMPRDKMQHQLRQMYRDNLPMREWRNSGDWNERERGRPASPRGDGRRRNGLPPRPRHERGPPHHREGRPGPPLEDRPSS